MNFRKLLYISALILTAVACDDEEEMITTPSLDGVLRIMNLPEFIAPKDTVTLTAKGVVHPDGGPVGYYWKVLPSQTKYDTTEVFGHRFSDSLKTYTVYCYAYAVDGGYSGLSSAGYTTAVAPGYQGSISGINYKRIAEDSIMVRHMPYYYKKIGDQTWTLNNMAVREGLPFRNAEVMSEVFGRYYNFADANAACDSLKAVSGDNWVLPSRSDWDVLESYLSSNTGEGKELGKTPLAAFAANACFNGKEFWEFWPKKIGKLTNGSGFSALSTGYANVKAKSFHGEFEYASFWTSDSVADSETEAYYKYVFCDQPGIFTGKGNKESYGASVRCIRK